MSSGLSASEDKDAIKDCSKKKPRKANNEEKDKLSSQSEDEREVKQAKSGSQMSMSRQLVVANRKREQKEQQKLMNQQKLAKTASNQKALTSHLNAKANEDLVPGVSRLLL